MITDNDKKILLYLEKYKYGTITQLQKVFYPRHKSGYNLVRRRMTEIGKHGYTKIYREPETNKLVYIWNDKKINPPTRHRLIVLDVLAELHAIGTNVQIFDVEKYWMDGKIKSDGLAVFTLDNIKNKYRYFIEVQLSGDDFNLEKYDRLAETYEWQNYLDTNKFPRILLVTDRIFTGKEPKSSQVFKLDTRLTQFSSVVVPPKNS
jgi:hypothetical protein